MKGGIIKKRLRLGKYVDLAEDAMRKVALVQGKAAFTVNFIMESLYSHAIETGLRGEHVSFDVFFKDSMRNIETSIPPEYSQPSIDAFKAIESYTLAIHELSLNVQRSRNARAILEKVKTDAEWRIIEKPSEPQLSEETLTALEGGYGEAKLKEYGQRGAKPVEIIADGIKYFHSIGVDVCDVIESARREMEREGFSSMDDFQETFAKRLGWKCRGREKGMREVGTTLQEWAFYGNFMGIMGYGYFHEKADCRNFYEFVAKAEKKYKGKKGTESTD